MIMIISHAVSKLWQMPIFSECNLKCQQKPEKAPVAHK